MDPSSIQFNNCSLPVHIILAHGNNKSFDDNEKKSFKRIEIRKDHPSINNNFN